MGYRDELGAAKERLRTLEAALEEARAENERLRNPPATDQPLAPAAPETIARSRRVGRIYYHAPSTYFPALRMIAELLEAARTSAPVLEPLDSDSVLAWALHYGVRAPLTVITWPFYWLSMFLLVPLGSLYCLLRAVVQLPIITLSRLSFSPVPPPSESYSDAPDEEQARMILWIAASVLIVPMLFTWRLLRAD